LPGQNSIVQVPVFGAAPCSPAASAVKQLPR
jgi:hypothetical protein